MSSFFSIHQLLISINFSLFQFVQQQAPNQQNRPILNLPSYRTAAAYLYNPTTRGNTSTFDAPSSSMPTASRRQQQPCAHKHQPLLQLLQSTVYYCCQQLANVHPSPVLSTTFANHSFSMFPYFYDYNSTNLT